MDDGEVLRKLAERLDYIEEYLVHLGQVSGYRYAPFNAAVLPPEVVDLVRLGKQNDAIKLYRQLTNANFAQAKEAIAAAAEGR
jgi:hypothetical protein